MNVPCVSFTVAPSPRALPTKFLWKTEVGCICLSLSLAWSYRHCSSDKASHLAPVMGSNFPSKMIFCKPELLQSLNGCVPLGNMYNITPRDQQSAFSVYEWLSFPDREITSGAMYTGIPTKVSSTSMELKCFERPKSVILRRLDVDFSKWIKQSLIIYHIRYYLFISATDSLSPFSQILQVFNVLSKIESWNRSIIFLHKIIPRSRNGLHFLLCGVSWTLPWPRRLPCQIWEGVGALS